MARVLGIFALLFIKELEAQLLLSQLNSSKLYKKNSMTQAIPPYEISFRTPPIDMLSREKSLCNPWERHYSII